MALRGLGLESGFFQGFRRSRGRSQSAGLKAICFGQLAQRAERRGLSRTSAALHGDNLIGGMYDVQTRLICPSFKRPWNWRWNSSDSRPDAMG
jgi:hypothetical protein